MNTTILYKINDQMNHQFIHFCGRSFNNHLNQYCKFIKKNSQINTNHKKNINYLSFATSCNIF